MRKALSRRQYAPPLHGVRAGWQGSKTKLRPRDAPRFAQAEPPLFREVARAVCGAEILPRKELFEAWKVAARIDDSFAKHERVADLAAGHGLLGWLLLLLAWSDGRPRTAVCVDVRMPASADVLSDAITSHFGDQVAARMLSVFILLTLNTTT